MPWDRKDEEEILCRWCGAPNFSYASFCIECGHTFGRSQFESADEKAAPKRLAESPSASPVVLTWHLSHRKRRIAEAVAGLLLLSLVVGYALCNWGQTTSQSSAYHDGEAAEKNKDWDRALESFARAGDMADAQPRREAAQQKVALRNLLYAQAKAAEDRRDWSVEIDRLQRLSLVQPSYGDSDSLLQHARQNALAEGLNGLVYLKDRGADAGLYIRDIAGRTSHIAGTDARSIVRSIAPDGGTLAYDRPARPSEVCRSGAEAAHGDQEGRTIVIARLQGDKVVSEQPLPCLDSAGRGVFARHGLWWYSWRSVPSSAYAEVYYRSDDNALPTVRLSDVARGKRVVAIDPHGLKAVIVQASISPLDASEQSQVYLEAPDGSEAQQLSTFAGEVLQASVSDDSRWLLFVTQKGAGNVERDVLVLPMPGTPDTLDTPGAPSTPSAPGAFHKTEPRTLFTQRLPAAPLRAGYQPPDLQALFVPSSDGQSRVAIAAAVRGHESLSIFDPAENREVYESNAPSPDPKETRLAGRSADGNHFAFRGQQGEEANVALLNRQAGAMGHDPWSQLDVPAYPEQQVQVFFAQRSDYAIISVTSEADGPRVAPLLYAVRIDSDGTSSPPSLSTRIHWPHLEGAASVALTQIGDLLAYVTPSDELYAVFLDGQSASQIASDVGGVWSLSQPTTVATRN